MLSAYQAMAQIGEIRLHLTHSLLFRGYRSSTTALTGVVAVVAALVQSMVVIDPVRYLQNYLTIWFAAAVLSLALVFAKVLLAHRGDESALNRELSTTALLQLAPSIVAGLLVTLVIALFRTGAAGALPGVWMILISLGIFASRQNLPRLVVLPAGYYMLAGLWALTLSPAEAMRPWVMGSVFGFGQFLAAGVLYVTLERKRAS